MNIEQILAQIGFDSKMALFNLINFLIVFLILKKFLFARAAQVLDERKMKVAESMAKIEQGEKSKEEATKKAEEVIEAARVESDKILEVSRVEAVEMVTRIKADASTEAEVYKAKAKLAAEKERSDKLDSLNHKIIEVVMSATEKVSGEKSDHSDVEKSVQTVLMEMK